MLSSLVWMDPELLRITFRLPAYLYALPVSSWMSASAPTDCGAPKHSSHVGRWSCRWVRQNLASKKQEREATASDQRDQASCAFSLLSLIRSISNVSPLLNCNKACQVQKVTRVCTNQVVSAYLPIGQFPASSSDYPSALLVC